MFWVLECLKLDEEWINWGFQVPLLAAVVQQQGNAANVLM
jgi:hypothetical protein